MSPQLNGPRPNLEVSVAPLITKRVITDIARENAYLVRWSVWLPFGYSIKLHQILRADEDRCTHDHPWRFVRIILKGGYIETHGENARVSVRKPWRPWAPWRVYYCSGRFRHRITELLDGPSWTLVLCGHRFREWGFFTRDGWLDWQRFVHAARDNRVLWCDDGRPLNEMKGSDVSSS